MALESETNTCPSSTFPYMPSSLCRCAITPGSEKEGPIREEGGGGKKEKGSFKH